MCELYEKFLNSKIDTSPLGLEIYDNFENYFCTPKNAKIIGSMGVDGVHFCFIEGFENIVFAVSPMEEPYVRPVAQNFGDFLALILKCKNTSPIEQAWMFKKEDFYSFLEEDNRPTEDGIKALNNIKEVFDIKEITSPWEYIHSLQESFDYASIPFSEEYYEVTGEEAVEEEKWSVSFSDSKPGRELDPCFKFSYCGKDFIIPGAYICDEGIILDVFMEFKKEDFTAFYDKWMAESEGTGKFSRLQQMVIEYESPAAFPYRFSVFIDGREVKEKSSSGSAYIKGENSYDSLAVKAVEHYNLDKEKCYYFARIRFNFREQVFDEINSLGFTIEEEGREIPSDSFKIEKKGEEFKLTNPETKEKYTLKVLEYEDTEENIENDEYILPGLCKYLKYEVTPPVSNEVLRISDLSSQDNAVKKTSASKPIETDTEAAAIGIIGGADGPTAIFVSPLMKIKEDGVSETFSSLSFERRKDIEWTPVFYIKGRRKKNFTIY